MCEIEKKTEGWNYQLTERKLRISIKERLSNPGKIDRNVNANKQGSHEGLTSRIYEHLNDISLISHLP